MGRGHVRTDFDKAQDRLFQEIQRCHVLEAGDEDVDAWLDDAVEYLGEQFPSLTRKQLDELKGVGRNYVAPTIPYGEGKDATTYAEWTDEGG